MMKTLQQRVEVSHAIMGVMIQGPLSPGNSPFLFLRAKTVLKQLNEMASTLQD